MRKTKHGQAVDKFDFVHNQPWSLDSILALCAWPIKVRLQSFALTANLHD